MRSRNNQLQKDTEGYDLFVDTALDILNKLNRFFLGAAT